MPEQILISQASSSEIPPSILPVSHDIIKNDNNTSLDNSTKEFKPDGTSEREQGVNETQRGMQSRHLTMIGMCFRWQMLLCNQFRRRPELSFCPAIGGTIGTGIFLSAGIVRRSEMTLHPS